MKTKLLLIVSILCLLAVFTQPAFGQDSNLFPTSRYVSDSLKTTLGVPSRDTVDINFDPIVVTDMDVFTITAYSSAADTIKVYSKDAAGNFVQRSVQSFLDEGDDATLITTTSRVEFKILDGEPTTIRLVCNDYSATTFFVCAVRRSY